MSIKIPYSRLKIQELNNGKVSVSFYLGKERFRYMNGRVIKKDIFPNKYPKEIRGHLALELLVAFKKALDRGWTPHSKKDDLTISEYLNQYSINPHHTKKYQKDMERTLFAFQSHISTSSNIYKDVLGIQVILKYLQHYSSSPSTFNHERKRLSAILTPYCEAQGIINPVNGIKKQKEKQVLHKPFDNVSEILEDIRFYNHSLYICCMLTYGCLLRPHQEIRNLKWGDFDSDLNYIRLSGKRNKSGRNRVVPIPDYIKRELVKGESHLNIFSGTPDPYGEGYFKLLWKRYKKQSQLLSNDQTLYSFRHSGAINVYKRTGSLSKLQHVMGHASLAISLSYLRGLELCEIDSTDMPKL